MLLSDAYTCFHALKPWNFWPSALPFPYDSTSESIKKTSEWLKKDAQRPLSSPLSVYAALTYAASILSYLRNRDLYVMEAIFHSDLLERPFDLLQNLCLKLDLDNSGMDNTLLPYNPEVSRYKHKNASSLR